MGRADILWLYYDYVTEMFDRTLPHELSKHGDGVAVVFHRYVYVSNRNAKDVMEYIYSIAEYYGMPKEEMSDARKRRLQFNMDGRIREYEYISSKLPYKLDFIEDYNKYNELMTEEIRQNNLRTLENSKRVFRLEDWSD